MAALRPGLSWSPRHPCRAMSKHKHTIKTIDLNDLRNRYNTQVLRCRPSARWTERLRDSPVPWQCRAWCQQIGFKAAMALRPSVQRRNLEHSNAARGAPAKNPEENRIGFFSKYTRLFSRMFGDKSGKNGGKIGLVIENIYIYIYYILYSRK